MWGVGSLHLRQVLVHPVRLAIALLLVDALHVVKRHTLPRRGSRRGPASAALFCAVL